MMKKKEQIKILENEYIKDRVWDKFKIRELSQKLDLTASQIYKWNWD